MNSVNHGQSKDKKEYPLLSDRFEKIVVITEEEDQTQSCERKDDLHFPAEIVFDDESSVELETEPPLVSSERAMMDYISLKGIKNRTGVEEPQLLIFVLKELIDNALDFIDQNIGKAGHSSLEIKARVDKSGDKVKISVSNSNFGLPGFTADNVERIFDFNNFYSSKRNQYKINRGALGDALKELACIPVSLAECYNIMNWNQPITIKSGTNQFVISLIVDRTNQTVATEIRKEEVENKYELTEIEITLPAAPSLDFNVQSFLQEYAILNPHIDFQFNLVLNDEQKETKLNFKACQAIENAWSNLSSIYYYNRSEFRNLCLGLDDNTASAYRLIQIFREGSNLKKNCLPETIGELKQNAEKIEDVWTMLRAVMGPRYKLDIILKADKNHRIDALRKGVEQLGFTVSDINYQLKQGYWKTEGIEFPFLVEAAIIQTTDLPWRMRYIEGINSSPQHYFTFLSGGPETFQWKTRNRTEYAASIYEILENYVFTKSSLILRDLELHEKYKDKCFIVWSITTCNEKIRRLVEPGTPPAASMFKVIKKFIDAGVCCGVNIDPILPLITDSKEEIELILDSCVRAGIKHVFGAVLRLRDDIWQRMRTILKSLDLKVGIDEYQKIYQFTEPLKMGYNLAANQVYSGEVMHDLQEKILERGMFHCFPDYMKTKAIERRFVSGNNGAHSQQLTLLKYL